MIEAATAAPLTLVMVCLARRGSFRHGGRNRGENSVVYIQALVAGAHVEKVRDALGVDQLPFRIALDPVCQ